MNECNNTYHRIIKIKPIDVEKSTNIYFEFEKNNDNPKNPENPKFEVDDL